jgi:hypothetical protein
MYESPSDAFIMYRSIIRFTLESDSTYSSATVHLALDDIERGMDGTKEQRIVIEKERDPE